jgi:hypothetical protein
MIGPEAHQAQFDQVLAGLRDIAKSVTIFYSALIEGGMPELAATYITSSYVTAMVALARPQQS